MGYACTAGKNCITPPIWWMKHKQTPLLTLYERPRTEKRNTSELLRVQSLHCQDWWLDAWECINDPHQCYVKAHHSKISLRMKSQIRMNEPGLYPLFTSAWYKSFPFAFPFISPFSSQQEMIYSHIFCWFKRSGWRGLLYYFVFLPPFS